MLPDYFYTACIPDGLQLYMKVSDCLDSVERQIKNAENQKYLQIK